MSKEPEVEASSRKQPKERVRWDRAGVELLKAELERTLRTAKASKRIMDITEAHQAAVAAELGLTTE